MQMASSLDGLRPETLNLRREFVAVGLVIDFAR
jgi:hypothetical protein